jgi:integrase
VKLGSFQGSPQVKAAIMLLPHLFARPGELRHMKWSEINFETAEWRHTLSKTKTEQTTPLSRQVLEILRAINPITNRSVYVFPGMRTINRPISENTMNSALKTLGIDSEITTSHGFRATARTILDEVLKFRPEVLEQQLGHAVRDPNGRAYNRTTHLEERKLMMQRWSDFLDEISPKVILR